MPKKTRRLSPPGTRRRVGFRNHHLSSASAVQGQLPKGQQSKGGSSSRDQHHHYLVAMVRLDHQRRVDLADRERRVRGRELFVASLEKGSAQ